MKAIAYFCLLFLLMSCVATDTVISREDAMERARTSVAAGGPELVATDVPITNLAAERMTLSEAEKRIWGKQTSPSGQEMDRSVWLVTMDGLWHAGMAIPNGDLTPDPNSDPNPLHHFFVIVDATTGEVVESAGKP